MFVQKPEEDDKELQMDKKLCKLSQKMIIVIVVCSVVVLVGLWLMFYFVFGENDEDEKDDNTPYNPIPSDEDLDFTEEAHHLLSREVATQTMVLARNNDCLPLRRTD